MSNMIRHTIATTAMFAALATQAGCEGGPAGPVDVSKLQPPTAEQQEAIKAADAKVDEEEFGKPMPGSKGMKKTKK